MSEAVDRGLVAPARAELGALLAGKTDLNPQILEDDFKKFEADLAIATVRAPIVERHVPAELGEHAPLVLAHRVRELGWHVALEGRTLTITHPHRLPL